MSEAIQELIDYLDDEADIEISSAGKMTDLGRQLRRMEVTARMLARQYEDAPDKARDALMIEHVDLVADACRKFKLSEPHFRAALRAIAGCEA